MIIGLMSNTHDRLDAIEAAIDFFNRQGVNDVLHAGDWYLTLTRCVPR
jgi:hypothetical protein